MLACRKNHGCPASFYLDSRCSLRKMKNCWETENGCQIRNCKKDCHNCKGYSKINKVAS